MKQQVPRENSEQISGENENIDHGGAGHLHHERHAAVKRERARNVRHKHSRHFPRNSHRQHFVTLQRRRLHAANQRAKKPQYPQYVEASLLVRLG